MVMQLIYIRYVSYSIDKMIYGEFVLLQSLIVALSYVLLQIPTQAYKRFYNSAENKHEFISEFQTLVIFINLFSVVLVALYGFFFTRFDFNVMASVVVYFWLLSYFSLNRQLFLLNMERLRYLTLQILEAAAKFIIPIIVYSIYGSLESLLFGIVLGYILSVVVLRRFLRGVNFKFYINLGNLRRYLVFAYPMLFVSFFSWGITFSDRYFIDYYLTSREVAIYSILATVAGLGTVIGQIYSTYVNPQVLRDYEENKYKALRYLKQSLIILTVTFIVFGLIAVIMPQFIWTIFIESEVLDNQTNLLTLYILMASVFLTVLQTALSMYLTLLKKLKVLVMIYAIAFVTNLIGNIFIQDYGIIAAAVSTITAYLIILVIQFIYIKRSLSCT